MVPAVAGNHFFLQSFGRFRLGILAIKLTLPFAKLPKKRQQNFFIAIVSNEEKCLIKKSHYFAADR